MEAMAARMRAQPGKFKLRKLLAEHPFGTIKRWFGYTHFLLKGLEKVRCEWSLTTLAAYKFYAAGLQSQTSVKLGKLRETHGGGGLKARRQRLPAKKEAGSNL